MTQRVEFAVTFLDSEMPIEAVHVVLKEFEQGLLHTAQRAMELGLCGDGTTVTARLVTGETAEERLAAENNEEFVMFGKNARLVEIEVEKAA